MKLNEEDLKYFITEKIRLRPGMYVGSTSSYGVLNLIFYMIEDFIEEQSSLILKFQIHENNIFEISSSRPFEIKFSYGILIAQALSSFFEVTLYNNTLRYEKGILISEKEGSSDSEYPLHILFEPDKSIFNYKLIEYHQIYHRCKELAQLNNNVTFILNDKENKNTIHYDNGILEILKENIYDFYLNWRGTVSMNFDISGIQISAAIFYYFESDCALSFVNNHRTFEGGTHVQGSIDGIFDAFKIYIRKHNDNLVKIERRDVVEGLNYVISIKIRNPSFAGATKRQLTNVEIKSILKKAVSEKLLEILEKDTSFFEESRVLEKVRFRETMKRLK